MWIIAVVPDAPTVRAILDHLGNPADRANGHSCQNRMSVLAGRRRLSEWRTPYSVDRISGLGPIAHAKVRVPRRVRNIVPPVGIATVPRVRFRHR